ncbi:pyridoxamine 5'-phosphate oxidase family protein [Planctomicrobium piriforme]|uniref:General stress protein 26 n=1 Tax=Planctomicrobium piriforme TaxID=1576369 RepID=A0A1I3NHQ0_9PLAN|nr:pyridoxamine 5'-phosphate oxidase family protein [Planctomicrobium piriforme]SFJ08791.1 General stress protein 26 [Planctomicrobium piriforme]
MSDPTPAEQQRKLGELIHEIYVAMLVTVAPDGSLHGRPMATNNTKFDGTLWFLTDHDSVKVLEVQQQPQVNVSYADPKRQHYVSVSGTAEVTRDRKLIEEQWTPSAKVWFPDGPQDERIALLKVTVTRAEYWDAPSSRFVLLTGLVKSILTGQRPGPVGKHGEYQRSANS